MLGSLLRLNRLVLPVVRRANGQGYNGSRDSCFLIFPFVSLLLRIPSHPRFPASLPIRVSKVVVTSEDISGSRARLGSRYLPPKGLRSAAHDRRDRGVPALQRLAKADHASGVDVLTSQGRTDLRCRPVARRPCNQTPRLDVLEARQPRQTSQGRCKRHRAPALPTKRVVSGTM